MNARVSAIVPVYNGERFLADALESIFTQTCPADEVIVIDDGSTDSSFAIASERPGVRYLRQANAGHSSALNAGAAAATGDFLAFLDADDVWIRDKLSRQLAAYEAQPELDIVFGLARQRVEPGVRVQAGADGRVLPARLPSAMLVRRRAWRRVGPFSSEWDLGSVVEWCARADDAGLRTVVLDCVVYERRIHGKNATLTHPRAATEYARMLKSVIDRRRSRSKPASDAAERLSQKGRPA